MIQFLFFGIILGFSVFFYLTNMGALLGGLRIVSLFLFVTERNILSSTNSDQRRKIIRDNSLFLIWGLILIGILLLISYFRVPPITILMIGRGLTILLWLGSLLAQYKEGTQIFEITYRLFAIIVILYIAQYIPIIHVFHTTGQILAMSLGLYSFIGFVFGTIIPIEDKIRTVGIILLRYAVMPLFFIITYRSGAWGMLVAQCCVGGLFWVLSQKMPEKEETYLSVDARDILAGKSVLKKSPLPSFRQIVLQRAQATQSLLTPIGIKRMIYSNIIITLGTCMILVTVYRGTIHHIDQILYRLTLGFFFYHFMMAHTIYPKIGHIYRCLGFFMLTMAVYVFLLFLYDEASMVLTALLGIGRNIGNTFAILYAHHGKTQYIQLKSYDYLYRIAANCCGTIISLYLLRRIESNTQLLFAVSCIYVGIFLFLTYYNRASIKDTKASYVVRDIL